MKAIFPISLLMIFSSSLFPQQSGLFSPEKRKAFADYLFCEKDYLRAAEEYEAINGAAKSDSLSFRIGLCSLKMHDFEKAKDQFFLLENSSLGEESKVLYLKTSFLLNKNLNEKEISLSNQFKNKDLQTAFRRLELAAQIKAGMNHANLLALNDTFEENDAGMLQNFSENFAYLERKSPVAAVLFSAIIPGTGKIYTKNYGDGITSLIVTGLFAFLSYDNFHAKHDTRGWIFTGLTAFFYSGNIYGSYISARNYNREKEEELNNEFDSYLNSRNYFVPEEIEGKCK